MLRRRRQWFERMTEAYTALWWISRGGIPTVHEAEERVTHLRAHGPTPYAFALRVHFPPPDSADFSAAPIACRNDSGLPSPRVRSRIPGRPRG